MANDPKSRPGKHGREVSRPEESARTVLPNSPRIKELRLQKGWRVEDLAKKARCSTKTIENAEGSRNVYPLTLKNIADALGVAYAVLVSGGDPMPEPPKEERSIKLQFAVSIPFDKFDKSQLADFIDLLKRLIPAQDAINVLAVTEGSTVITVEMSERDVRALLAAYRTGKMDEMLIKEIRLPPDFTHGKVITTTGEHPLKGGIIRQFKTYFPENETTPPEVTSKKRPKPDPDTAP